MALLSIFVSIVFIVIATNLYLKTTLTFIPKSIQEWTLTYTIYDLKYIYWQKYNCYKYDNCTDMVSKKESLLARPIFTYGDKGASESCLNILFLGDSFSTAPFTIASYSDFFAKKLSFNINRCVSVFNLASGGVGNSQELAKLSDEIEFLNPDIVIWQFYWNDLYENVVMPVHTIKNNKLKRKKAWRSSLFLAGFLNQNVPFLQDSMLGKFLFQQSAQVDLLRDWVVDPHITADIISYNQKFIPLAIEEAKKITSKHNSKLLLTLSPLECTINTNVECEEWQNQNHNYLRKILNEYEIFIDMKEISSTATQIDCIESKDLQLLFAKNDLKNAGARHLSEHGEEYFGSILFSNFKNNELYMDLK